VGELGPQAGRLHGKPLTALLPGVRFAPVEFDGAVDDILENVRGQHVAAQAFQDRRVHVGQVGREGVGARDLPGAVEGPPV
jgi:hypothetical protein